MEFNTGQKLLPITNINREVGKKTYVSNDYVVCSIRKGVLMSEKYREIFNDKTTMYLFLKSNIVRGEMIYDKLNIYKKYYQNQQVLACSFTERQLSEKCNLTRYRVQNYIKTLKSEGVIRTEKVWVDKNNSPIIFILGTYSFLEGKKKERFYLDNIIEDG
jgi:predicted transcriptional regulator